MTTQQREWVRLQKTIKSRHPRIRAPPSPDESFRRKVFAVVTHKFFELYITSLVVINIAFMLSNHYPAKDKWVDYYCATDYLFAAISVVSQEVRMWAPLQGYACLKRSLFACMCVGGSMYACDSIWMEYLLSFKLELLRGPGYDLGGEFTLLCPNLLLHMVGCNHSSSPCVSIYSF